MISTIQKLIGSLANADQATINGVDSVFESYALTNAVLLAQVAAEGLQSSRALRRIAAAIALGRAAECGDETMAETISEWLVQRLRQERDDRVIEYIATALGHAWGRRTDHKTELLLARDPDRRCRLAAVMSLALSAPTPLPLEVQSTLRALKCDDDPEIKSWAEIGLAELDSD